MPQFQAGVFLARDKTAFARNTLQVRLCVKQGTVTSSVYLRHLPSAHKSVSALSLTHLQVFLRMRNQILSFLVQRVERRHVIAFPSNQWSFVNIVARSP